MFTVEIRSNVDFERVLIASKTDAIRGTRNLAYAIRDEIRLLLSVPYPPASKEGEAPRRRTGKLKAYMLVRENLAKLEWRIRSEARSKAGYRYQKALEPPGHLMRPHMSTGMKRVLSRGIKQYYFRKKA